MPMILGSHLAQESALDERVADIMQQKRDGWSGACIAHPMRPIPLDR